jgi:hypothetical protein
VHGRYILGLFWKRKGFTVVAYLRVKKLKLKSIAYSTFINSELKWLIVIVTLLKEESPISFTGSMEIMNLFNTAIQYIIQGNKENTETLKSGKPIP